MRFTLFLGAALARLLRCGLLLPLLLLELSCCFLVQPLLLLSHSRVLSSALFDGAPGCFLGQSPPLHVERQFTRLALFLGAALARLPRCCGLLLPLLLLEPSCCFLGQPLLLLCFERRVPSS